MADRASEFVKRRLRPIVGHTWNASVLLVKCSPAILLWLLYAGCIRIEFREDVDGVAWDAFWLPGWSRNELSWRIGERFFWRWL